MSVDTTIYVHETTLQLVDVAIARTGKKRNHIIIALLERAMADSTMRIKTGCAVRYQERDCSARWRTVHVRLKGEEAEYFTDMRKFFKRSVSLLLAEAARAYLAELVENAHEGKMDNYPFSGYSLSREVKDGLVLWHICWGSPPNPSGGLPRRP